jgi:hypothetical protein
MRPKDMIGALDQQRPEVDIASLGDAELWVVVPGLPASRPQAEITAHIATSLKAFHRTRRQSLSRRVHSRCLPRFPRTNRSPTKPLTKKLINGFSACRSLCSIRGKAIYFSNSKAKGLTLRSKGRDTLAPHPANSRPL